MLCGENIQLFKAGVRGDVLWNNTRGPNTVLEKLTEMFAEKGIWLNNRYDWLFAPNCSMNGSTITKIGPASETRSFPSWDFRVGGGAGDHDATMGFWESFNSLACTLARNSAEGHGISESQFYAHGALLAQVRTNTGYGSTSTLPSMYLAGHSVTNGDVFSTTMDSYYDYVNAEHGTSHRAEDGWSAFRDFFDENYVTTELSAARSIRDDRADLRDAVDIDRPRFP
jgi:hypothetical protein